MDDLCVVCINFQTPDLLEVAIESFRKFYPTTLLLLVDNGSKDASTQKIRQIEKKYAGCTSSLLIEKNIFHGPAMHRAIDMVRNELVFFLDSDTETRQGGFLEKMIAEFASDKVYAVGRIDTVNKRGFHSVKGTPIVLSPYMMIRRKLYHDFSPFEHRGMPTLRNFAAVQRQGYVLKSFPVEKYIAHFGRGTASRYGYALGMRGKVDYVLNKLGL